MAETNYSFDIQRLFENIEKLAEEAELGNYDAIQRFEAISQGREISRNQHSEFVIHDKHGVIRQSDSHGNDPYPPKG